MRLFKIRNVSTQELVWNEKWELGAQLLLLQVLRLDWTSVEVQLYQEGSNQNLQEQKKEVTLTFERANETVLVAYKTLARPNVSIQ